MFPISITLKYGVQARSSEQAVDGIRKTIFYTDGIGKMIFSGHSPVTDVRCGWMRKAIPVMSVQCRLQCMWSRQSNVDEKRLLLSVIRSNVVERILDSTMPCRSGVRYFCFLSDRTRF